MQRTPIFEEYAVSGGKAVDFHGWELPVQFEGIVQEHLHTRAKAGLFDCSHMGEFLIEGADNIAAFNRLVFGDMINLRPGRCRYTGILNERGCIVDDCVALRFDAERLYVVTNAGPLEQVGAMLAAHVPCTTDLSAATAKLDIQGPMSRAILLELGFEAAAPLAYWSGTRTVWRGAEMVITRAGYTGELGYELFVHAELGAELWRTLVAHPDVAPCGLGARDTLRTEMGYPLNGQDVDEQRTPLEGGMDRFIAWDTEFPGKAALVAQRDAGGYPVLTGVVSLDRRAPRHGFEVKHEGKLVGMVASGTFGPSVGTGIGLAYLPPECRAPGTKLTAGPRDLPLEVMEIPLYKHGTCRMKI